MNNLKVEVLVEEFPVLHEREWFLYNVGTRYHEEIIKIAKEAKSNQYISFLKGSPHDLASIYIKDIEPNLKNSDYWIRVSDLNI